MRASWKPILIPSGYYKLISKKGLFNNLPKFITNKSTVIKRQLPFNRLLLGAKLLIHNGRYYTSLTVQRNYLGLAAGNFFFSKKFSPIHSGTSFVFKNKQQSKNLKKLISKKGLVKRSTNSKIKSKLIRK